MDIKIVTDEAVFSGLKEKWNDLLKKSNSNTIFLTWEWVHSWWEVYSEMKSLLLIVAEEDGRLLGIAPLYATRARYFGIRPLSHVEFMCTVGPCSEYLDFIVMKGLEKEIIYAMMDKLFSIQGLSWDVLNLTSIKADSVNLIWIKKYGDEKGYRYEIYNTRESRYIPLPQTFDGFMAGLTRKQRYNSKLYKKILSEKYEMSLQLLKTKEDLESYFDIFVLLHQKRWEEKDGEGSFTRDRKEYIQFHQKIAGLFFQNGWLYLVFLKVRDKQVAAQYSFVYNNIMSCFQVGFDPEWAGYHVGTVLQLLVFEDSIARKISEYDFLRGTEEYKYRWTKITRSSVDIVLWKSRLVKNEIKAEKAIRKKIRYLLPEKFINIMYNRIFLRDR